MIEKRVSNGIPTFTLHGFTDDGGEAFNLFERKVTSMALPTVKLNSFDTHIDNLPMLVFGLFQDEDQPEFILKNHPQLSAQIAKVLESGRFQAKLNQTQTFTVPDDKSASRFLAVGLGKRGDFTPDFLRQAAASAGQVLVSEKISMAATEFMGQDALTPGDVAALVEGFILGSYQFLNYKASDSDKPHTELETLHVLADNVKEADVTYAVEVARGVCLARDLGNHPSNVATPAYLANTALAFADAPNMTVTVWDRDEFTAKGFGGLAGVAQGSDVPPKFILMEYMGGDENSKTLGLVGKGLTFDSGGISIKPAAGMDEMKYDMLGGAAVLGIMSIVAKTQPKINIIAAVPATENMNGGKAYKPGDVLKAYNGKTIEILNTDAEGRLILADGISYVTENYNLDAVMDYATLTGAVIVALGHRYTGMTTNDQEFADLIDDCGAVTQDRVWQLPLDDEYAEDIKSKIADIKNTGAPREAGTIAAGAFLREFVKPGTPWCHLDIAGSGWLKKWRSYTPEGATGAGVRITMELIHRWST